MDDRHKMRGRGRPPMAPGESRSEVIVVRVTPAERELLDQAADTGLSAWARDVLLRAAKRRAKKA